MLYIRILRALPISRAQTGGAVLKAEHSPFPRGHRGHAAEKGDSA